MEWHSIFFLQVYIVLFVFTVMIVCRIGQFKMDTEKNAIENKSMILYEIGRFADGVPIRIKNGHMFRYVSKLSTNIRIKEL